MMKCYKNIAKARATGMGIGGHWGSIGVRSGRGTLGALTASRPRLSSKQHLSIQKWTDYYASIALSTYNFNFC